MFEPAASPQDLPQENRAGAISGGDDALPPLLRPQKRWSRRRRLQILAAAAAAALIFAADVLSPLDGAVAVLYTAVVLLVARVADRRFVLAAGAGCCVLVLVAFVSSHWGEAFNGAYVRLGVSLTALAITTLLAVRSWSAETTAAEQARMLELTHDTVTIRDADDRILYWNDGAEALYGWTRKEAVGRICRELLETQYPAEEVAKGFAAAGSWSGELTRRRRDGTRIVLASRWLVRYHSDGRPAGIIETSADLTAERKAEAERRRSEERYGAIFRAAGFAIWEADWSGRFEAVEDLQKAGVGDIGAYLDAHRATLRQMASAAEITEANEEAVKLFEAPRREALIGRSMSIFSTTAAENTLAHLLAQLADGAAIVEAETQFCTLRGKTIDVLLRACIVAPGEGWRRMIITAIDLTERNLTQARLDQTLAELAHAARVALLGQFAASIAHEVNQPLAAITTYAQSGRRWLTREAPAAQEVRDCLDHIIENGKRAGEVVAGLKALTKKGAAPKIPLHLAEAIEEAVALMRRELTTGAINLRQSFAADLPRVLGDRVQIQQVVINLAMNGAQAMAAIDPRRRDLFVATQREGAGFARISVRDSGEGIKEQNPDAVFEPFFTTKSSGTGMGLSICRSIVEAHGGRIWAENNDGGGATFHFTLPLEEAAA
ncbi:PAS domain-containing sensor histidine kinase [Methylocella silvestris]|uniref:histidine kinase n=1 Tax=Methylocella silvestris TaxID=199596 RepID=A0A2J7TI07_METSI|nr:ATP-binding protein [Methylocella silvestris]PNG26392.1 PAS domain-containing sensor histidine kinase [Methylocella silvestris]